MSFELHERERAFRRRMREVNFARNLRAAVLKSRAFTDAERAIAIDLAELVHEKICGKCCTWAEFKAAAESAHPGSLAPTTYVELPDDELTPVERPSAMDLRAESGSWLGRLWERAKPW